jgi:hypothetical protein
MRGTLLAYTPMVRPTRARLRICSEHICLTVIRIWQRLDGLRKLRGYILRVPCVVKVRFCFRTVVIYLYRLSGILCVVCIWLVIYVVSLLCIDICHDYLIGCVALISVDRLICGLCCFWYFLIGAFSPVRTI